MIHVGNYTIRKAGAVDVPALYTLQQISMRAYAAEIPLRSAGHSAVYIEALTENEDEVAKAVQEQIVLIAEAALDQGNKIICGSVRLDSNDSRPFVSDDLLWRVSRFIVAPAYQGMGIGKLLHVHLTERAVVKMQEQNIACVELYLYTAVSSENNVNFYQKLGYQFRTANTDRGYTRGLFTKKLCL